MGITCGSHLAIHGVVAADDEYLALQHATHQPSKRWWPLWRPPTAMTLVLLSRDTGAVWSRVSAFCLLSAVSLSSCEFWTTELREEGQPSNGWAQFNWRQARPGGARNAGPFRRGPGPAWRVWREARAPARRAARGIQANLSSPAGHQSARRDRTSSATFRRIRRRSQTWRRP